MKKILAILIGLGVATAYAVAPLSSPQIGYTPVNGRVLMTNGATSTWVATSTLGLGGGGSGTVTSVSVNTPLGLTASTSTCNTACLITLALQGGYIIPLSASTTEWSSFYDSRLGTIMLNNVLASGNFVNLNSSTTNMSLGALLYDSTNATGTNGQYLKSTGTSTLWTTITGGTTATSSIWKMFQNTATGLTYDPNTGTTTLTSGYIIPLSASTTQWANFLNASNTLPYYVTFSYASSTFASTSWITGSFPTFSYASSTFASTSWVTNTFAPKASPTFTGTASFALSSTTAATVGTLHASSSFLFLNASGTGITATHYGNMYPTGLTNSFLAVDVAGKIIATTTPGGTTYTGTYPIIVTGSVISSGFSTSTINNFTAQNNFTSASSTGITAKDIFATSTLWITNLASTFLAVDPSGKVIATTTPSGAPGSGNSAFTIGNAVIYNATTTDNVGIGTTTPSQRLNVYGNLLVSTSSLWQFFVNTAQGTIGVGTTTGEADFSIEGDSGHTNPIFSVSSSTGANLFSITPQGYVAVNGTSSGAIGTTGFKGQFVVNVDTGNPYTTEFATRRAENTTASLGSQIYLGRQRGTIANPSAVVSGDTMYDLYGYGFDGVDYSPSTAIHSKTEGTIVDNKVPGVLTFDTASSSGGLFERLRINSYGNINIGTTTGVARLFIQGTSSQVNDTLLNIASSSGKTYFNVEPNGTVGIGTTTGLIFAGQTAALFIDNTDRGTQEGINIISNINEFFENNIVNTSQGASAQACQTATNDQGTVTTGFISMCANSSNFSNSQAWNTGGAGDTSLMSYASGDFELVNATAGKNMHFLTGGSSVASYTRMTIDGNGNIGIGTTTPAQKLSVNGNTRLTGAIFDSTNASGTAGQVLQSTGTSTIWVTNAAAGVSGSGTVGRNAYWTSSSNLAAGSIIEDGTVAGINATSSTVEFNIKADGGFTPFNVASSTGNNMFTIASNGRLDMATTTSTTTNPTYGIGVQAVTVSGMDVLNTKSMLSRNSMMENAFWNSRKAWFTPGIVAAGLWQNTVGANLGTAALVTPTVGVPYAAMRRTTFASVVTTPNQQVGTRSAAEFFRGKNTGTIPDTTTKMGGFFFAARVGFTTWTANNDLFVGLSSCTTACITGTTTLTNLANTVGFGVERTNGAAGIVFLTNDASGVISTTTISGQPALASNNVYNMYMYQAPNDYAIYWRIDNASTTSKIAEGVVRDNLPATTTLMTAQAVMGNGLNIVVGNATLGVGQIYVETER